MTYQSEVLADSPAVYYRLSETSGTTVADSSGGAHDTNWNAAPTRQADLSGDPASQSALIAGNWFPVPVSSQDMWSATGQYTLEAIIVPDSVSGIRHIINSDDAISGSDRIFQLRSNGTALELVWWGVAFSVKVVSAAGALAAGVKHHVAATYDGTAGRIYVDGTQVATTAQAGSAASSPSLPIYVGRQYSGSGVAYTGLMDEVAIYGAALSPTRIAAHAAAITATATIGTVAATAPALTGSIVGNVTGGISGTVAGTLPALTGQVTGDVPAPITGTVAGTLPALTGSVQEGGLTATLPAASTLEVGAVILPPLVTGTYILDAASSLTVSGPIVATTPVNGPTLDGGSILRITMPRQWGEDPRTGRPPYTVRIIGLLGGVAVCELTQANLAPVTEGINVSTTSSVRALRDDDRTRKIRPGEHQAQVWRGTVMLTRCDIGAGVPGDDGTRITFPLKDPRGILYDGRVIGRIPKLQLLKNAAFTQGPTGLAYWSGAWDAGSALAAPPTASVVDEPEAASGKALVMGAPDKVVTTKVDVETTAVFVPNSSTYLSGGEQKIRDVGTGIPTGAVVRITGFTANDGTGSGLALSLARAQAARGTLAAMGKGFVFKLPDPLRTPNLHDATVAGRGYYEQIAGGLKANRRVTIAYEGTQTAVGHRQFMRQYVAVTQPVAEKVPLTVVFAGDMKIIQWLGAPKDGWAMRLILHPAGDLSDGAIIEDSTAAMDELTPRVRWAHYSTSVDVPADGKPYVLEVRLYPPAGSSAWKDIGLWPEEQLGLFGVDQALHVKALVEHAQDTTMGHGDLGIGTRTPLTGIPRTKEYRFSERMPVGAALDWYTAISHGLDIDCETTPTATTIVTHYPQQGSASGIVLRESRVDSMIVAYKPLWTSARDLASSVIMQADGSGASRPEAYARDTVALGGRLVETVVSAEDETPLGELDEGAAMVLAQSVRPRPGWQLTYGPSWTTWILDRLHKGDTARLLLPREGVDGLYRVMLRTIDPATDTITDTLLEV